QVGVFLLPLPVARAERRRDLAEGPPAAVPGGILLARRQVQAVVELQPARVGCLAQHGALVGWANAELRVVPEVGDPVALVAVALAVPGVGRQVLVTGRAGGVERPGQGGGAAPVVEVTAGAAGGLALLLAVGVVRWAEVAFLATAVGRLVVPEE